MKLFRDAVDLFVLADGAPESEDLEAAKEHLRRGPLVFAGRVVQSQQIVDQLAAIDALPSRLLPCGDLELVKSFALAGLGVAVLPRRVAGYCQGAGCAASTARCRSSPTRSISLPGRRTIERALSWSPRTRFVAHGRALDGDYEE